MNLGVKSVHSKNWSKVILEILERLDECVVDSHIRNAIRDNDDVICLDLDGCPIYEPGTTIDNPVTSTAAFDTVEEMVAFERPWELDECVTLGWSTPTGPITFWKMVADDRIAATGDTILDSFESYGRFVKMPAS